MQNFSRFAQWHGDDDDEEEEQIESSRKVRENKRKV
jgi:hypothetical protein